MSRYGSPVGDLPREVEQYVEDVLGAAQSVGGRRPAHAGEVGIDPSEPRHAVEDRLEAGLRLAVVDAGAVQHQHRSARPVLDVVDRDLAGSNLHAGNPIMRTSHGQVEGAAPKKWKRPLSNSTLTTPFVTVMRSTVWNVPRYRKAPSTV